VGTDLRLYFGTRAGDLRRVSATAARGAIREMRGFRVLTSASHERSTALAGRVGDGVSGSNRVPTLPYSGFHWFQKASRNDAERRAFESYPESPKTHKYLQNPCSAGLQRESRRGDSNPGPLHYE
jgi:hypothetical protein